MFAAPEVTAHVFRDGGGDFSYDGYGEDRGRGDEYYYDDGYDDDYDEGGRYQERAASVSLESSLPGCFASLPGPILESLWKDPGTFSSDFVLVTEFSEVVGPKPVLTVPDGAGGEFDQNHFALRVMSVDYQLGSSISASAGAGCDSADSGGGAGPLTMARDSKHLLHDFAQGASAYVHHFTFYDLEARGFVRPYCMSYVTADEHKLLPAYERLAADFERASECFKQGNRRAFARSVSELLQDLEFTKAELLRRDNPQQQGRRAGAVDAARATAAAAAPRLPVFTAAAVERSNELGNVERLLFDHRQLLNRVRGAAGAAGDAAPTANGGPAYTPKYYRQRSCKGAEKTLKSMRELCGDLHFERGVELLSELQRRYRADTAQLAFVHSELWPHAFAAGDCERLFPELGAGSPGEEEPDEDDGANHNDGDDDTAKECVDSWHRGSSGVAACSLESYASCVESVPIGVMRGASATHGTPPSPPPPPPLLHQTEGVGSAGSGDSIEVLRTEWPQDTGVVAAATEEEQDDEGEEEEEDEQDQDEGEAAALVPVSGPGGPDWAPRLYELRRSHSVHRNVSEDSIEVLGSTAFALPHGTEAPPDPIAEETAGEAGIGGSDEPSSLVFYSCDGYMDSDGGGVGGDYDDVNNGNVVSTHAEEAQNEQLGWCPGAGVEEGGRELRIHELEPQNEEELSLSLQDRFSDSSSSHLSRGLETPAPAADGFDALQLARRLGKPTIHVLFALLSGRTLAVLAEGEVQARRTIDALLPFVPAGGSRHGGGGGSHDHRHNRPAVEPWRTDALRISDIATVKLVGMKSSQAVHDALLRYRRYVSVLDTASGTLTTPAYQGALLANLSGTNTRSLVGNRAYLARAGAILAEFSSKAFVLRSHLRGRCCPAGDEAAADDDKTEVLPRDAIAKWCDSRLGLLPDDARIVRHFSELTAERAMGRRACQPALRVHYVSSSTFRFQPFRATDVGVDS